MIRDAENELCRWLEASPRKPLILRGARQVGKSTLVRSLAKGRGMPLWEVNLERHPQLRETAVRLNVQGFLQETSLIRKERVGVGPGILFLDEIQAVPEALNLLRYLHEERPDLPVIAAGSLLEFALAELQTPMPVGRIVFHHLGPVTFREFFRATEGDLSLEAMDSWTWGDIWSETLHQRTLQRCRDFLAVGGMPEATAAFAERGDFQAVAEIHRSILDTYREDFGKYAARGSIEKIRRLFDFAPANIGQKLRWSRVHEGWKSVDLRKAFDQLDRAGVLAGVHHSDGTGLPLSATVDDSVFKLLHLDVGLAQGALGGHAMPLDVFRQGRFVNEGPLAEQFVGQHLRHLHPGRRPELHYWLREGRSGNAEVDFLVAIDDKVVPVEVKSGAAGAMRSLHQFIAIRGGDLAVRFDLNPPSVQNIQTECETPNGHRTAKFRLLSLPLCLAYRLPDLVRRVSA